MTNQDTLPQTDAAQPDFRVRTAAFLLVLYGLALWAVFPANRSPWAPDEARYVEVAREMSEAGSWLIPRLNGEVYTQKPPGFFWLIAIGAKLTGGFGVTAVLVPTVLASLAVLLLTWRLGMSMGMTVERSALGACLWASALVMMWQGRFGQIDMVVCALGVAQLNLIWSRFGRAGEEPPRHAMTWFWALAGVGMLFKGPVSLFPQLLAALLFLLATRQVRRWRELFTVPGIAAFLAIPLLWLVPALMQGGREYWELLVVKQTVGRYVNPWHHHHPWYYYAGTLVQHFMPWGLLLPILLMDVCLRRRRTPGEVMLLAWIAGIVLFFSLSSGKRHVYILTAFPALGLLYAQRMVDATPWRRWGWFLVAMLLAGLSAPFLLMALDVDLSFTRRFAARLANYPPLPDNVFPLVGATLAITALAMMIHVLRRKPAGAAWSGVAGLAVLSYLVNMLVIPVVNQVKSAASVAAAVQVTAGVESPVVIIAPRLHPGLLLELKNPMTVWDPEQGPPPVELLSSPGAVLVVDGEDVWEQLEKAGWLRGNLRGVWQGRIGGEEFFVAPARNLRRTARSSP